MPFHCRRHVQVGIGLQTPHVRHALSAGLAMIEWIYALRGEFEKRGWPRLAIGVGINTGVLSFGNMSCRFRTAYTVIGEEVNRGSRVDVIVGENVVKGGLDYVFREPGLVRFKGKHKPVSIYQPPDIFGAISGNEHEELNLHSTMRHAYRGQQ